MTEEGEERERGGGYYFLEDLHYFDLYLEVGRRGVVWTITSFQGKLLQVLVTAHGHA